ncbi:P-loop containing nucleoside triphosphate hydrolase protein [Radiomyces spectabilis]|uniref:P-loop containing nucleoside triphosphate hydrolase protein n=1 Tax=Radiomyces spectabilis TaxID=64574 RepID=UPI002220EB30|nr:P-loop containing nucleoside triphosphate hydrolase protein [Radiomyces spectabilis]KAI8368149.1 P-loop containing nucleoside triphosphate hydrolase protein [Radiomyces spectabilis]
MLTKLLLPTVARISAQQVSANAARTRLFTKAASQLFSSRSAIIRSGIAHAKLTPYALLHTTTRQLSAAAVEAVKIPAVEAEEEAVPEKQRFDSIEAINGTTQKALDKVFGYQEMSSVQAAVLSRLPNEEDMFVKAKTGTGKTLAFLIAALETALKGKSSKDLRVFEGTSIMVISPTRELANQIAEEAQKLVSFYPFKVHCLVGGDSKRRQIVNLERRRCDIVVATPGRLNDMLSSVPHFRRMCQSLKVLVLDEADQLLDMGFKAELQRILNQIPDERQTMLFSATINKEIRENLGKFALSPKHTLIDTVGKDDVNTNAHVKQSAIVAPYETQLHLVKDLLENYEAANSGKVIVFLPTTKSTMVYAQLLKSLLPKREVFELHSRKNQDQRSKIADRFRRSRHASILVTSDVSARGVDYPGVSLVLQIGVPSTREQYIHRLGRTGRAGREGEGIIMLAPFEQTFITKDIGDLPVQKLESPELTEEQTQSNMEAVGRALRVLDEDIITEVYTAYLGYYSSRMPFLGKRRSEAIAQGGEFLKGFGIEETPHLSPSFISKLGLSDSSDRQSRSSSRRRSDSRPRSFSRSREDGEFRRFDRRSRRDGDDDFFQDRRGKHHSDREFRPKRFEDRDSRPKRFEDRDSRPKRFGGDREFRPKRFNDEAPRSSRFGDDESSGFQRREKTYRR